MAVILKKRKLLADSLEVSLAGKQVTGDLILKMHEICSAMLPRSVHPDALAESLRCMVGRTPCRADLDLLSYRLVGNIARLKLMRPVVPWAMTQSIDEKVLAQVIAYRPEQRRTPTTRFTIQLLTGLSAGLKTQVWWDLERCYVVSIVTGFDRPAMRTGVEARYYLFTTPPQLVGLYGEVLINGTESSKVGSPVMTQFKCPNHLRALNRLLIKKRFRVEDGYTCPNDYPVTFPCHHCPVGYVTCPAAVHAKDFTTGPCDFCKDAEAVFDPDWSLDRCVNCIIKEATCPS